MSSSAEALLERNTDSFVFMNALPALHRVAWRNDESRAIFLYSMKYWLTDKEDRHAMPLVPSVKRYMLKMLADAQAVHISKTEADALHVMVTHYETFAPAEYLQGGM